MTDFIFPPEIRHRKHLEWLHQLDYMQDQIKIFQHELLRVVHEHPDYMSILEHVDEYRGILLRKLQHIDDFRSSIAIQERLLAGARPDDLLLKSEEFGQLEARLEEFFGSFDALKPTLRRFVSRND
jgi:hypothetical protein